MSFKGVNINKLTGMLGGTNPSTDGEMMLAAVIKTADLPAGTTHYTHYELKQLKDAEDLGINESLDANKKILIHQQIKEFFRLAPDATLHLCLVPETLTDAQLIMEKAEVQAYIRSNKDIKGIAIMGATDTFITAEAIVEDVQAVVTQFATEKRLIDFVLIQGNGQKNGASNYTLSALPDYRAKNAPNVSICIGQDPKVAVLEAEYGMYADVCSVLGMIAVRQVNENCGSVDIINKPDNAKGKGNYPLSGIKEWQGSNLSDGRSFATLSFTDQNTLNTKGYIYAGSFEGYEGTYLSGSATSVELASDYAYIENNRTWNKAARAIRQVLLPLVRGIVKKDPQTGFIRNTVIASWESRVNKALETMVIANEISGYQVYIDPKQLPTELVPLKVQALVVKDGIVHEFDVDLGMTNSI